MIATTAHYLGIDLHKRQAQVAVLDGKGEVVEEVRVATRTSTTSPSGTLAHTPILRQPAITTTSTIHCRNIWM